uniref:HTH psq-type domain-containing protein n=1 Tax=Timema cristinae TaxID=61476 RepID=A0A7R9CTQ8_TIMCR|nr:unnamed protein product [Timema cristinae]
MKTTVVRQQLRGELCYVRSGIVTNFGIPTVDLEAWAESFAFRVIPDTVMCAPLEFPNLGVPEHDKRFTGSKLRAALNQLRHMAVGPDNVSYVLQLDNDKLLHTSKNCGDMIQIRDIRLYKVAFNSFSLLIVSYTPTMSPTLPGSVHPYHASHPTWLRTPLPCLPPYLAPYTPIMPPTLPCLPPYLTPSPIMVSKCKKKMGRQTWSEETMQQAIRAVKENKMGWLKASQLYNIPRTTLRRRARKLKNAGGISKSPLKSKTAQPREAKEDSAPTRHYCKLSSRTASVCKCSQ